MVSTLVYLLANCQSSMVHLVHFIVSPLIPHHRENHHSHVSYSTTPKLPHFQSAQVSGLIRHNIWSTGSLYCISFVIYIYTEYWTWELPGRVVVLCVFWVMKWTKCGIQMRLGLKAALVDGCVAIFFLCESIFGRQTARKALDVLLLSGSCGKFYF